MRIRNRLIYKPGKGVSINPVTIAIITLISLLFFSSAPAHADSITAKITKEATSQTKTFYTNKHGEPHSLAISCGVSGYYLHDSKFDPKPSAEDGIYERVSKSSYKFSYQKPGKWTIKISGVLKPKPGVGPGVGAPPPDIPFDVTGILRYIQLKTEPTGSVYFAIDSENDIVAEVKNSDGGLVDKDGKIEWSLSGDPIGGFIDPETGNLVTKLTTPITQQKTKVILKIKDEAVAEQKATVTVRAYEIPIQEGAVEKAERTVTFEVTIFDVELKPDQSTQWLVIEDEKSVGIGKDEEDKPIQKAENKASIVYEILPKTGFTPIEVLLEIPGTEYKQYLPKENVGLQTAIIETKDGKLKGKNKAGNIVWYPKTEGQYFPPGEYKLKISVKASEEAIATDEYEGEEKLTINSLMANLRLSPDVLAATPESLCPYTHWHNKIKFFTAWVTYYGLLMRYDLNDDVSDLIFEITGGDMEGTKSLELEAKANKIGSNIPVKWECYDATIAEPAADRYSDTEAAADHVVKEANYTLTINMERKEDIKQVQKFEISIPIEYDTENMKLGE